MPIQITIVFLLQSCKNAYLDIGNEFIMFQVRQMLPLHFKTSQILQYFHSVWAFLLLLGRYYCSTFYTISQRSRENIALEAIKTWNIQFYSHGRHKKFRSTLFCDFTQRRVVNPYRRLGTTYRSHLQGSSNPKSVGLIEPWRWHW
jgi:uncharacterized membrane protein YGL010W